MLSTLDRKFEGVLNGETVEEISEQLTNDVELHTASILDENLDVSFMGITPAGPFDVTFEKGLELLRTPNPTGLPNSDVVRPYFNGNDLNKRSREQWTIDFGVDSSMETAAGYAGPFEHVLRHVKPERDKNRREAYKKKWWLYAESRPAMRTALNPHSRYLATCMVAKHRLFVWLPTVALPANVVIVFGRSDDYFYGMLQSSAHELWSLRMGTRLETRPRYTPTTCFETFPFPTPSKDQEERIAAAAKSLENLRAAWLNPPEWTREEILEFPGSVNGPWARYVSFPDSRGIGVAQYPRFIPKDDEAAKQLTRQTLTNLYNERPTWLELAHQKLDEAVFAAYGWDSTASDEDILARLLALNQERRCLESSIN